MHEIDRIIEAVRRVERGVIATIVATRGSTYRQAGGRAVIGANGEVEGTISGGCLERDLAARLAEWLSDMQPRVITYDSSRDDDIVFGLGLGCRGVVDVHIEPFDATRPPRLLTEFKWNGREPVVWTTSIGNQLLLVEMIRPPRALAIFGGGPDVDPVARLGEQLGWNVTVFRPRDLHPEKVRDEVDLAGFDAAVIMTHNYLYDQTLLDAILPSPIAYIGLLGPKSRGAELLGETSDPRVHSPVGLDLGGETPEDIALSIVAEIQSALNERSASALRDLQVPLHVRPGVPSRR